MDTLSTGILFALMIIVAMLLILGFAFYLIKGENQIEKRYFRRKNKPLKEK